MVLTGDLANLAPGDSFTIDLGTGRPDPGGRRQRLHHHHPRGGRSNDYQFRKKITIDKDELGTSCSDGPDRIFRCWSP